ncbi:major facilitator superfamily domain-containing protein [Suillus clintonianus]|uniref:major facilitator superfamily domain-containing protein n=1 Tax=Suillus clintonianus TaxID=1904413 RepID=UPI001B870CE1|nr:major facilitator superfamily domain-containing protein [Suillus clintonianus]KAG2144597.1 major facilitator superfamily domain-containing protein [Suillus clintonianus]
MTHHEGDSASRVLATKCEHQVLEPVDSPAAAPVSLVHEETDKNATLQTQERDEEAVKTVSHTSTEVLEYGSFYVDFEDGDRRNPVNFSLVRKWVITINACAFTGIVAGAASSYTMGYSSMTRDLNCTLFQASVGLSVYPLGFALAPLVTSSFSEEFGRFPFYIVSSFLFLLTEVMIALAPNIQIVIVARAIGGCFGSTGATLVAGTIADIWLPHQRGFPMSLYALAVIASSGLGPMIAGWIEAKPSLEWRWIQWIHALISGVYFISALVVMRETRSTVILAQMARQTRKDTRDGRYRARSEENKPSLKSMIAISCTRPLRLLFTEPTVQSFSLWIGFVWGVLYYLIDSVSGEFKDVYGFGVGETGSVFTTIAIGSLLGYVANAYQERLYKKYVHRKGQEARLYIACVSSITLPAGMLLFAWTARADIPWVVPLIGLTLFMTSAFVIYQVVFVYLADCYGPYASSALAGQSLCRNILAAIFPLITTRMNDLLTYKWAGTVFALIAAIMIPIPYILFFYGSRIRRRSPVSQKILEIEEEQKKLDLEKL